MMDSEEYHTADDMEDNESNNNAKWEEMKKDTTLEMFKKKERPVLCECREMVVVPGGISEKIRNLTESNPESCWKYASSELLIMYHFNVAHLEAKTHKSIYQNNAIGAKKAKLETFYGYINYRYSPYEFYIQPKPVEPVRARLDDALNEAYNDDIPSLTREQLFVGVPCVVRDLSEDGNGSWRRAIVLAIPNEIDSMVNAQIRIRYVDWGNMSIVTEEQIKPLEARFGRMPPLALFCRMFGVSINDLFIHKVKEFQDLMSEIKDFVKIELLTTTYPYLVNLFHPTVANWNLGQSFFPPPPPPPPKPKDIPPDSDSDEELIVYGVPDMEFDDEDEIDLPSPAKPPFVFAYERMEKPLTRSLVSVWISHIENARFIYVHRNYHLERLEEYGKILKTLDFDQLPELTERLIRVTEHLPCLVKCDKVECGWVRGLIRKVNENDLVVQSVDYGWKLDPIPKELWSQNLKALPSDMDDRPLTWLGRLTDICEDYPCFSETLLLRELLKTGQRYEAIFDKRSHGPPFRLELKYPITEDGSETRNFVEVFNEYKKERHISRSREMVPFDAQIAKLSYHTSDSEWVEEVYCCRAFIRGCLDYIHHI